LNRDLVEWDIAFTDEWDGRGHYTKDTGEFACVCGLAEFLMPFIHHGIAIAKTIDVNDDTDYSDIFNNLAFVGMAAYAHKIDMDIDDIYDSPTDELSFNESFYLLCLDGIDQPANKILDRLADVLEQHFD
jgi:hypothetical protein